MKKISLHRILEETLGIGKIKNKEDLKKLLADRPRLEAAAKAIRETEKSQKKLPNSTG